MDRAYFSTPNAYVTRPIRNTKQSYAKNRFSTVHLSPPSCISQITARKVIFGTKDILDITNSYHKKNKTPLCVCEYKMWVEFLHEILFPHFFHPTLNTGESRTTFQTIVYEIQLYGYLHPINPEIDRTYHRLVRQNRNLPFHSVPDSVSDSDSTSNSIPVSVHSVQYTDFVHFVALSYLAPRTFWTLQVDDVCKSED
ncbi:hypothetical protein Lal_00049370, partial [Lupinus albus]